MAQSQSESETTFTCPICLSERTDLNLPPDIIHDQNAEDQDGSPASFDADQKPDPPGFKNQAVFELTACSHKFCTACLRAYVRSKLLDGEVDIPCCHFKLSAWEEDFHLCNILIEESDIRNLTQATDDGCGEYNQDEWCCEDDCDSSLLSTKEGNNEKKGDRDQLWSKYKKLQFDAYHGKDVVRRCPKCDEAQLFDEEIMKQYQAKHFTHVENILTTGGTVKPPAGSVNRWERMVHMLRQNQRNRKEDATSMTESNQKDEASAPGAKGREENIRGNDQQEEHTAPDGLKVDACNSQDEEECKLSEASEASQHSDDDIKSPPSLVKSPTPVVLCQSCNAEFCYFHSNAHPGTSCIEYHKKSLESDRANIEYANSTLHAKPCPNCGISVSKEGGCNQIKCGSCGTHFCWICSTIVDDGAFPEHFRWWNLRGCANMQLDEAEEPKTCTIWGARLLSTLQIIVLGVPALVLTLLSMIICPCLVPGCGRTNRERVVNTVSFWGSFLSSLLLLPFTCLGMLIISALYFFLAVLAFFVKIFTSQGGSRSNSAASANLAMNTSRDTNASGNAASPEDLIREIESIFERMEEGIANSNSNQ